MRTGKGLPAKYPQRPETLGQWACPVKEAGRGTYLCVSWLERKTMRTGVLSSRKTLRSWFSR